jgi:cell division protein FtsI/penicillin-binding protein 2
MENFKRSRTVFLLCFAVFILYLFTTKVADLELISHRYDSRHKDQKEITIRVNTFRRLDLLEMFLDHYEQCSSVQQIQVVWSDQENKAPLEWLKKYTLNKVLFEIHDKNSLSNRFRNLVPVPTEAVLSIDDDLIIPCEGLVYD